MQVHLVHYNFVGCGDSDEVVSARFDGLIEWLERLLGCLGGVRVAYADCRPKDCL